ncbi:MAG: cell division ATPase MinD, partial [Candidatus Aenigmatarchaeota archaeon]
MTRIITVASGKGGVGKTTLVSNLASALANFKKSVIAIDGNLTTANLGIHLGIPLYPVTLQDVLNGDARLNDALYYHPAGFTVLPSDISLKKLRVANSHELVDIFYKLVGGCDFIIVDSAAGLGKEALSAIEAADEMITVTNPELPALTDALKLGNLAEKYGTHNLGVIVNRCRGKKHEFSLPAVENFLEAPILGKVPEDPEVPKSGANKKPLLVHKPMSPASQHIMSIAARLIGENYRPRSAISHRLFGWLR